MRIKVIAAFAVLSIISACDGQPDNQAAPDNVSSDTLSAPVPNYTETKHGIYYYTAGVSDNDKMSGQAAGAVIGFRYRGKNKDGDFVVQATDGGIETCSDPCKIVHLSDGEAVEYTPDSVIGAVFSDAMNGFLKTSSHDRE